MKQHLRSIPYHAYKTQLQFGMEQCELSSIPSPQYSSKAMHDYQSKDYHLLLKLTENMTTIILKKNRVILTCT